ncbi:MAG: retron system putative HNH endonuclease [Saprospiraceae bacterium]
MKHIQKLIANEPASLREYRSTPGASYNDCNKNDIRIELLNEQGFICAYCNRRLKNDHDEKGNPNTRIEHYQARSDEKIGDSLKLNFMNMLGVCNGNEGKPKHLFHCDKSRGNQELFIDPRNELCEGFVKYQSDGTIYSDDERVEKDINEVLKLNNDKLIRGRKEIMLKVVSEMKRKYKKRQGETWKRSDLLSEINVWNTRANNKFHPFCNTAIFYLNKKLSRLT